MPQLVRNGEAVHLKGMLKKNGETFDACVQFSAYERRAAFVTPEWLKEMRKESEQESAAQGQKQGVAEEKKEAASFCFRCLPRFVNGGIRCS